MKLTIYIETAHDSLRSRTSPSQIAGGTKNDGIISMFSAAFSSPLL